MKVQHLRVPDTERSAWAQELVSWLYLNSGNTFLEHSQVNSIATVNRPSRRLLEQIFARNAASSNIHDEFIAPHTGRQRKQMPPTPSKYEYYAEPLIALDEDESIGPPIASSTPPPNPPASSRSTSIEPANDAASATDKPLARWLAELDSSSRRHQSKRYADFAPHFKQLDINTVSELSNISLNELLSLQIPEMVYGTAQRLLSWAVKDCKN